MRRRHSIGEIPGEEMIAPMQDIALDSADAVEKAVTTLANVKVNAMKQEMSRKVKGAVLLGILVSWAGVYAYDRWYREEED